MLKMSLTTKEYRLLLDVLSISNWVLNAYRNPLQGNARPYTELQQKLLSFAEKAECAEFVDYSNSSGKYYFSTNFENVSPFMKYILLFEEETFWDELVNRMVQRDLINKYGETHVARMTVEERVELENQFRSNYENEFIHHGIFNLVVESMVREEVASV